MRKKIESFNFYEFKSVNKGLKWFYIQEYNLGQILSKKIILTTSEKDLLLNALEEIIPNIIYFKIDYQIFEKNPLLVATLEINGILSVTEDFKLFTYFKEKYTNYL